MGQLLFFFRRLHKAKTIVDESFIAASIKANLWVHHKKAVSKPSSDANSLNALNATTMGWQPFSFKSLHKAGTIVAKILIAASPEANL